MMPLVKEQAQDLDAELAYRNLSLIKLSGYDAVIKGLVAIL